jgi:3'-phosphoadenosine 5'-phosphosulfate sulfotransferase (PAPS reductase)/FAD synthetase
MTMVRDLFGRKIEFKPIEDFDDDEIWETADGKRIPIVYLSDRHLKNAVRRFEELVSDAEEMRDFASERDQNWAEQKVEEVEDTLMMLEQEVERRKREKVVVREVGNPYYED